MIFISQMIPSLVAYSKHENHNVHFSFPNYKPFLYLWYYIHNIPASLFFSLRSVRQIWSNNLILVQPNYLPRTIILFFSNPSIPPSYFETRNKNLKFVSCVLSPFYFEAFPHLLIYLLAI